MSLHHMLRAAAGNSAGPSDPNFKNVSLLLTGDGTNGAQNNTFLDSSTNNFTITRNGNTTQGTFSPYGNLWSNYFDGSGDYLSAGSNAAFSFGTGAYTVEFWVNVNALSSQTFVVNDTTNGSFFLFEATGSAGFQISARGGSTSLSGGYSALSVGTWNHVVFVRGSTSANQTSIFVNGTRVANGTDSTNWSVTGPCQIGGLSANIYMLAGYMSNVRIVKGTAVYDPTQSTLTVPTTTLTAVSGTSLLTCQSNRFKDNSSNNFTLTVNGNTSVQRFSPFNPTAPYDAATIGGSGYFDGTGDYLTVPYSTTAFDWWTSDYTIEAWVYPTTLTGWGYLDSGTAQKANLVGNNVYNTSGNYWSFGPYLDGTVKLTYYNGTSVQVTSSVTVKVGQWNHIAMTKTSSGICIFVNGVGTTAVSVSGTPQSGTAVPLTIGAGNNSYINGYVSNLRIVKGTAIYSGTSYTVPTAPLTAITNTSLLCNFTNAGIPDAAMQNDLETVGNAQVSTSVKKYGTGSLAFDGNGDYLKTQYSQELAFGTGDFTIEFWAYWNSVSGEPGAFQTSTTVGGLVSSYTTGVTILITSGVYVVICGTVAGGALNTSYTVPTNTWHHVAIVRQAGTLKCYVNGNSVGSQTNTSNITATYAAIGGYYSTAYLMNGYIDDLRITKGYARYTANFTPPTAALPVY